MIGEGTRCKTLGWNSFYGFFVMECIAFVKYAMRILVFPLQPVDAIVEIWIALVIVQGNSFVSLTTVSMSLLGLLL